MKHRIHSILLASALIFSACTNSNTEQVAEVIEDSLPSWNDGPTKQRIISFVENAVSAENENFIPVAERIVTFDNDGTLWSEQPMYFQLFFAIDRVKQLAPEHPEWSTQQPYKGILEGDFKPLFDSGEKGLIEVVMTTHAGMSTDDFESIVTDWLSTATHPKTGKKYTEMVYQPMLELITYLQANHFKTYIVSGGGIEFMRPWTQAVYNIPKEQVIGSSIKTSFEMVDSLPKIMRLPELDFIDDKAGKPIAINKFIGKKPVMSFGNSDGDLQMLQWCGSNAHAHLPVYIHHTDSVREWAYDSPSSIGHLEKGLIEAQQNNWLVVDMAADWKLVYPE